MSNSHSMDYESIKPSGPYVWPQEPPNPAGWVKLSYRVALTKAKRGIDNTVVFTSWAELVAAIESVYKLKSRDLTLSIIEGRGDRRMQFVNRKGESFIGIIFRPASPTELLTKELG